MERTRARFPVNREGNAFQSTAETKQERERKREEKERGEKECKKKPE